MKINFQNINHFYITDSNNKLIKKCNSYGEAVDFIIEKTKEQKMLSDYELLNELFNLSSSHGGIDGETSDVAKDLFTEKESAALVKFLNEVITALEA